MQTSWRSPNGPARLVAACSLFTATAGLMLLVGCSTSGGNNAQHAGPSAATSTSALPSTLTPTPTTAVGVIYRVKRGDTLTSIARRFRVAASAIRSTNHIGTRIALLQDSASRSRPDRRSHLW